MIDTGETKIISARRGYEFRLDDLRLTMLCTEPVIRHIANSLQFKAAAVATPPAIFGPVQNTMPAGVVFQVGMWLLPDSQIVPIRFLNIEPQRIVIDVAGPSVALDGIYGSIRDAVSPITAPDGSPIIGEPVRVLEYSELSIQMAKPLESILAPGVRKLIAQNIPQADWGEDMVLAPSLQLRSLRSDQEFNGDITPGDGHTFTLSLRASTTPDQHTLFSSAPLDTDRHITFAHALAQVLTRE